MYEQVGLSLKAKTGAFNDKFGTSISCKRFRRLYKEEGITKQKMASRLGGVKLPSEEKQWEKIRELQADLQDALNKDMEFFQCDESLFSVDGYE